MQPHTVTTPAVSPERLRWWTVCSWKLLEVAAGKLPSKPVVGPSGRTNVVQWTLATAATNNLTVLRTFGHGTDAAFPLQIKPGLAWLLYLT